MSFLERLQRVEKDLEHLERFLVVGSVQRHIEVAHARILGAIQEQVRADEEPKRRPGEADGED